MRTEVEDPELVGSFTADSKGRINLGKDFAGDRVRIALERVKDSDEE